MRGDITMLRRLSLGGDIHKMIPTIRVQVSSYDLIITPFYETMTFTGSILSSDQATWGLCGISPLFFFFFFFKRNPSFVTKEPLQPIRADSTFAPSQWDTALLCNDLSHWLGANLNSALAHYCITDSLLWNHFFKKGPRFFRKPESSHNHDFWPEHWVLGFYASWSCNKFNMIGQCVINILSDKPVQ